MKLMKQSCDQTDGVKTNAMGKLKKKQRSRHISKQSIESLYCSILVNHVLRKTEEKVCKAYVQIAWSDRSTNYMQAKWNTNEEREAS